MPDHLVQLLDSLRVADRPPVPPPPALFLRALGRRRLRRRLTHAATACVVVVAALGPALLLRSGTPTAPAHDSIIASARLPDTAALTLARTNAGYDVEHLLLPDHGGGAADRPLRLGLRFDPSQIERWVSQ